MSKDLSFSTYVGGEYNVTKPVRIGRMGDFGSIPVLLGRDGQKYYVSETIRDIWRMCDGRRSITAIKRDLSRQAQLGSKMPEDIDQSLDAILQSLADKSLIEYCDAKGSPGTPA